MPDQEETTTRIEKLEQELEALKTRVAGLESRSGGSPTPLPSPGSPSLSAILEGQDDGPFGNVIVTGSGFSGGEAVTLTIKSVTRFPGGQQNTEVGDVELTATPEGKLDGFIGVTCPAGATTTHTIQAQGASSGKLPGEATVFC